MIFTINGQYLSKGLNIIASSLSTRVNLTILNNILIEALESRVKITATDLETATSFIMPAKIETEGVATVPARSFIDFFNALTGEVKVSVSDNMVKVEGEGNSASFNSQPASDFPVIPDVGESPDLVFDFKDFTQKLSHVIFSSATDQSRPILTGVLFSFTKDQLELVATDSFRLSYEVIKGDFAKIGNERIVIPSSTLSTIIKLTPAGADGEAAQVKMWRLKEGKQVVFEIDSTRIVSKILEGEYPAWEKIVPSAFTTEMKAGREEFLKAVKLSAVFARDSGNIVKLSLKNVKEGEMTLMANTREIGENTSNVPVKIKGPGGEIAFNYRYLADILNILGDEEVSFSMIESLNPGKFSGASSDFFHIIMPVRVQN